jgi:hypothetical protein
MLAETLISLAQLGGLTVVAAAVTDSWEAARRGFARVLGHGNTSKQQLAERLLEETRELLAAAQGADLDRARAKLAERWAGRLEDLLEEYPDAEHDLRSLVQEIQSALPTGAVSAVDHSIAVAGNVKIRASGGSLVAGVIHGDVAPPNPLGPGPARN